MVRRALLSLCLLLLLFSGADVSAKDIQATAFDFVDGDTLLIKPRTFVRLAGIDTPELAHEGMPEQFHARDSWALAVGLAGKGPLRLVPVGGGKDRYGRHLVEAFLPDGRSLNTLLVQSGVAFVYFHKDLPAVFFDDLLKAQQEAISRKAGFWPHVLASRHGGPYVGNENSRRFFSADCPEGKRVAARNRVVFANMKEAFLFGYSPARPCNIWPAGANVISGGE